MVALMLALVGHSAASALVVRPASAAVFQRAHISSLPSMLRCGPGALMQLEAPPDESATAQAPTTAKSAAPTPTAESVTWDATIEDPVNEEECEAIVQRLLAKASDEGMATVWRRAAFWEPGKASLLEIVNILGRFESSSEWLKRTSFLELDKKEARAEDERNGYTLKRHEMALRMGCAERAALIQNAPNLPFTNAALAASVGLEVADFEGLPVRKMACEVLYDALAESKSSLIPYAVIDSRRNAMVNADGSFNEVSFRYGHAKSTILFIVGLFFFGKANFLWVLVGVKLLHDARPDIIPGPKELGLFKIWGIV